MEATGEGPHFSSGAPSAHVSLVTLRGCNRTAGVRTVVGKAINETCSDKPMTEPRPQSANSDAEVRSPMEAHGGYRGKDWSPERLAFHQNLESFADRVGLIVGLQSNGKLSQEEAYSQIKKLWKDIKNSKETLL
jgi:hypothetical protein